MIDRSLNVFMPQLEELNTWADAGLDPERCSLHGWEQPLWHISISCASVEAFRELAPVFGREVGSIDHVAILGKAILGNGVYAVTFQGLSHGNDHTLLTIFCESIAETQSVAQNNRFKFIDLLLGKERLDGSFPMLMDIVIDGTD
jgi:hypothetical protein